PSGLTDRFVARLRVDSSGQFVVESDVADAGSGSTRGVCQLVARALNLSSLPAYSFSQDCIADPTGTLISSGQTLSSFKMGLSKFIERIQTTFSGRLHAFTSRLSPNALARTMQLSGLPTNWFNASLGWLKSALFPYSVDTFNPRISGSRGIFMLG